MKYQSLQIELFKKETQRIKLDPMDSEDILRVKKSQAPSKSFFKVADT